MPVSPFLTTEFIPNVSQTVIRICCELVRGTEEEVLRELESHVKQHSVLLDLSAVDRIDAAGIAVLITLYCHATEAGHSFSIYAPTAHVMELLHLVGLDKTLVMSAPAAAA